MSAATLNSVRYSGFRCATLTVDCIITPLAEIRIARGGPKSSNDAKSITNATESVARFFVVGSCSLNVEVRTVTRIMAKNAGSCSTRGTWVPNARSAAPMATMAIT